LSSYMGFPMGQKRADAKVKGLIRARCQMWPVGPAFIAVA